MTATTTLRLPEKKLRALRIASGLINKPMSQIVEVLLDEYLDDLIDGVEADNALEEEGEISWEEIKKELNLDV
jgi:predicted DNA-binding protein